MACTVEQEHRQRRKKASCQGDAYLDGKRIGVPALLLKTGTGVGLDTYCKVAKLTAKEQRPKPMRKRPPLAKPTLRQYADGQFRVAMGSNGVRAGGKRRESG